MRRWTLGAAFLLLLLAPPARADLQLLTAPEVDLRDCDSSSENLSKQTSSAELVAQCHDAVLAMASGAANRWSSDNSLHVFGHHGMLFIDHLSPTAPPRRNVVAGHNVPFRNVDALAIDEMSREIFVLDASTQTISVYSIEEDGDLYPRRKLASSHLEDGAALTIDEQANELLVLNARAKAVAVFGRKASSDGRRTENSTELKRKVDLSGLIASGSSLSDIAASSQHSDAFVLDKGSGRVVSYEKGSSRPAPKQTYLFGGTVDGAQYIVYSAKENAIRVMRSDGSGHEYSVGARAPASN